MTSDFRIIKLCSTESERADGLQFTHIADDECCLFVYDAETYPRFWGKNTVQVLYASLIKNNSVAECHKIGINDLTPVVFGNAGDIVVETSVPLQEGSPVDFRSNIMAVG